MRLHQPTGIFLLLWPCLWAIGLADRSSIVNLSYLILFTVGAVVMRGAGCIINDMIDRDIDKKIERTKARPLASGELSIKQASVLLGLLLVTGLVVLLELSRLAILLGLIASLLVVIYPFMKRFVYWPQLILGFTFNMGALIGWATVTGTLTEEAFFLYAACLCWTLGYDTIYAHQDKKDDQKAGVKSTAVLLQDFTKPFVAFIYAAMWGLLVWVGFRLGYGFLFYALMLPAAALLAWQVYRVDLDNPRDCMRIFKSNTILGAVVFGAILLQKAFIFL
jgi:4-hydroxybenzoate polyprenyltransferase